MGHAVRVLGACEGAWLACVSSVLARAVRLRIGSFYLQGVRCGAANQMTGEAAANRTMARGATNRMIAGKRRGESDDRGSRGCYGAAG